MTFTAIDVEHNNSVATIKIKPFERTQREGANHKGYVDVHTAIAEALETLVREPDHARALGRRAYQGVRERYTIEQSASALVAIYRDVIAAAPSRVA